MLTYAMCNRPMKITHLIKRPDADEFYHPCAKLFVSRVAPEVSEWDLWWAFQVCALNTRASYYEALRHACGLTTCYAAMRPYCRSLSVTSGVGSLQVFGVILEVRIPRNTASDESRGIAFIRFADFEACEKALHLMEAQVIAGREICIRYASDCQLPERLRGTPWQASVVCLFKFMCDVWP